MADDLQHIQRQIQKNNADAAALRSQSQAETQRSMQYSREGNDGQQQYHQQQADNLMDQAKQLEDQNRDLEQQQAKVEQEISQLEQQRDQMKTEMNQKIDQMSRDIDSKRGTFLSL